MKYDYKSLDWNLETTWVLSAFGAANESRFVKYNNYHALENEVEIGAKTRDGLIIEATFDEHYRYFCLYRDSHAKETYIYLFIEDDGTVNQYKIGEANFAQPLAKGLFHLGLLIPEIEAVLGVSVSAHQKLEWRLEFEATHDL